MREAVGGTWIFGIVMVFIVMFSSYLAISINYSKAFRVKNGIINIIEQNEGMSSSTKTKIREYLNNYGYSVYGKCPTNTGLTFTGYDTNVANTGSKYCVAVKTKDDGNLKKTYYTVVVFFRLDLPIVGNIFTFPVSGETKAVYFVKS